MESRWERREANRPNPQGTRGLGGGVLRGKVTDSDIDDILEGAGQVLSDFMFGIPKHRRGDAIKRLSRTLGFFEGMEESASSKETGSEQR